ncbi:MAG: L,D-transpeptidase, partial [Maribacter sp.]
TNPETLEKAYSNGCIGTTEADAWIIYYYAPLGTSIEIKYDLNPAKFKNTNTSLKDIYGYESQ